jgi:hypothetical protein
MRGSFRASRLNVVRNPRCVLTVLPICSKMYASTT